MNQMKPLTHSRHAGDIGHDTMLPLRLTIPPQRLTRHIIILNKRRIQPNPLHPLPHPLPQRRNLDPNPPPNPLNPRRHTRIKQPNHIAARRPIAKRRLVRHIPKKPQQIVPPIPLKQRLNHLPARPPRPERRRALTPRHPHIRIALRLKRRGQRLDPIRGRALQRNHMPLTHQQRGRPLEARPVAQQIHERELEPRAAEIRDRVPVRLHPVVVQRLQHQRVRGGGQLGEQRGPRVREDAVVGWDQGARETQGDGQDGYRPVERPGCVGRVEVRDWIGRVVRLAVWEIGWRWRACGRACGCACACVNPERKQRDKRNRKPSSPPRCSRMRVCFPYPREQRGDRVA